MESLRKLGGSKRRSDRSSSSAMPTLEPSQIQDKGKRKADKSSFDDKKAAQTEDLRPLKLEIVVESPPVVFYGSKRQSTGALFSARLNVLVLEPCVRLQALQVKLTGKATFKKPAARGCRGCAAREKDIRSWRFLSGPAALGQGTHSFPFSHMIPGHLPATTHTKLGGIDFTLAAQATTDGLEIVTHEKELQFQRALGENPFESYYDSHGSRWGARVAFEFICPKMIYPLGETSVKFRILGVVQKDPSIDGRYKDNSEYYVKMWTPNLIMWRIEERYSVISAACSRHSLMLGGEGKGIYHKGERSIGNGHLWNGWTTNFNVPGNDPDEDPNETGGSVEMEFPIAIDPTTNASCDVKSPTGLKVRHVVVITGYIIDSTGLVGGEVRVKDRGNRRHIYQEFPVIVTERRGMGISWDDERPPVYDDCIQPRPPVYGR
ncbi:hypothetical protein MMC20_003262 [Loxospora ochrophaea]|nr:hypothetical protein [Loxospora ochrophaea]